MLNGNFYEKWKKSRKLFFRFTRGVICNLNIDTDVGQLLEEPKNIVYSFLKEKEDLGPSILSPCSHSPSKVPVRLPRGLSGDVEWSQFRGAWERHCAWHTWGYSWWPCSPCSLLLTEWKWKVKAQVPGISNTGSPGRTPTSYPRTLCPTDRSPQTTVVLKFCSFLVCKIKRSFGNCGT